MIDLAILRTNPNVKIVITDERMTENAISEAYYPAGYVSLCGIPIPDEAVLQEDGSRKQVVEMGLAITGEADWFTHKEYGDSRLIFVHPAGGWAGTSENDPMRLNQWIKNIIHDIVEDQGASGPSEIFLPDWEMKTYISIVISYRE